MSFLQDLSGYVERRSKLAEAGRADLESALLDDFYNEFLRERANFADNESPVDLTSPNGKAYGKRLPYIGWFWRSLPFSAGTLPIGDSGEFVGFMANNKWDYPQRNTTPEEFAQVIAIIDAAQRASMEGGVLADVHEATLRELEKLWPLLQTFEVKP